MEMNYQQLDFLKELANIGTGHATTALSTMLDNKRLVIDVPEILLISFDQISTHIGALDQIVAGIYIGVSGDIQGHMAFILDFESAKTLVRSLTDNKVDISDELGQSALQEVGNIMVTSYLNALATMTDLFLAPSVPAVAIDMAGAVWDSILAGAAVADVITLIKTMFTADGIEISGSILFLPSEQDFGRLAQSLGMEAY